jgi:AcrR family transcriptional regulator
MVAGPVAHAIATSSSDAMNLREAAKRGRRQRILDAARDLIERSGRADFSMRGLAEAAGFSMATPYNLFGTRQGVMRALLAADLERYGAALHEMRGQPLDVLFGAVTLVTSTYAVDPARHRAVLRAVFGEGGRDDRPGFDPAFQATWRERVQAAIDAGHLHPETHADFLALELGRNLFACVMDWVQERISLDELETYAQYSFAMTLAAVATERTRDALTARVFAQQRRLVRLARVRFARAADTAATGEAGAPDETGAPEGAPDLQRWS